MFSYLENNLKNRFELTNILGFGLISGFRLFFSLCFWRLWIGLTRFLKCFLSVFDKKKKVNKEFLGKKK